MAGLDSGLGAVDNTQQAGEKAFLPLPDQCDAMTTPSDSWAQMARLKDNSAAQSALPTLELGAHFSAGKTTDVIMKVDGEDRHFQVHVPKDYDGSKPVPLMIVYNGIGYGYKGMPGGGPGMEQFTGLSAKSDADNFIVAYPDGAGVAHGYNNGQEWGASKDDVKFTRQMIDSLQKDLKVNPDKVYLAGFSEGGSFVHKAAGELSDKVAAVADISGYMTGQEKPLTHHVSELSIHSADDTTIPYIGTAALANDHPVKAWFKENTGFHAESTRHTEDVYRAADGITTPAVVSETRAPDGTAVRVEDSRNSKDGTEVEQVVINGRDHGWFGSIDSPGALSATDTVVDFLLKQQRPHGQ